MVITFNKLVANTVRISVERFASKRISHWQRGFLPGRNILDNVLELDHFAHTFSIIFKTPAALLFDFRSAFPSVLHKFMSSECILQEKCHIRLSTANEYVSE